MDHNASDQALQSVLGPKNILRRFW